MQWTPPEALVLQAFPNLYCHPRLADTFERPVSLHGAPPRSHANEFKKPVITTPGPPSADAGPSTQPMANGRSYKEIVDSYREFGTLWPSTTSANDPVNRAPAVIPTAVKAAWNTVDHVTRSKHVLQELQMMREAITRWRLVYMQSIADSAQRGPHVPRRCVHAQQPLPRPCQDRHGS